MRYMTSRGYAPRGVVQRYRRQRRCPPGMVPVKTMMDAHGIGGVTLGQEYT